MTTVKDVKPSSVNPQQVRRIIIEQSQRAHVGHIGSNLGVAEIVAALYNEALWIPDREDMARDRFVLSKGHAALSLYAVLHLKGWLSTAELNTFCGDGTLLGVHPDHHLQGVDFSTGSLGHGLSYGAGAALAARLREDRSRAFVLLSDAECNEGSIWEAAMFAAQHELSNLVAIIDCNGQQALGYTKAVIDIEPLAEKWLAFHWQVFEIDGNNYEQVVQTLMNIETTQGSPKLVIAKTVFGKGVSFMEGLLQWHYQPMSADEYEQAMREIGALQ